MKKYHIITIMMTAGIVYLSLFHVSTPEHMPVFVGMDKLVHAAMYAALAAAMVWELCCDEWQRSVVWRPGRWRWGICWVYPIALGGLMEVLQGTCTTYRTAEWSDFVADAAGVAVVMGAVWLARRKKKED